MGGNYSSELCDRVVDAGGSRREAARHFGANASFAVKLVQRATRIVSSAAARQGRPPGNGQERQSRPMPQAERRMVPVHAPRYSPDLNPVEMAFAKLKAYPRAARDRTTNALVNTIGDIHGLYLPQKCPNYLKPPRQAAD